jgi:betaine-homocysteine S-methyltransferase
MSSERAAGDGLLARLTAGPVICAEGYLFALERQGYLQAGPFVPEVVLDHPEVVERLHEDFVHAGSDVVEAFTYYAHREKLRLIGREDVLEDLNRQALRIAPAVADRHGCLMAGNICNTNIYEADDPATHAAVRAMFEEQIGWALEEGADYLIAETLDWHGEAAIALEVMRATGLPTVVTLAVHREETMFDGSAGRRKLQAPRGRRGGRRRAQLRARAENPAAGRRTRPRGRGLPCRRPASALPYH